MKHIVYYAVIDGEHEHWGQFALEGQHGVEAARKRAQELIDEDNEAWNYGQAPALPRFLHNPHTQFAKLRGVEDLPEDDYKVLSRYIGLCVWR